MIARGKSRAGVAAEQAAHEAELMTRKGWEAYGAFHAGDRRRALDLLGFRAQLVFPTFGSYQVETAEDPDVAYGTTCALTRGMIDFCAGDRRLLRVTFVPLTVPERAILEVRYALDAGVKGVTISPLPPPTHSITHLSLHLIYALLEERGVLYVGARPAETENRRT